MVVLIKNMTFKLFNSISDLSTGFAQVIAYLEIDRVIAFNPYQRTKPGGFKLEISVIKHTFLQL